MRRTPSARSSGTLIAGLILIELFGLTGTLVIAAACSAAAGVVALLLSRGLAPIAAGAGPEPSRWSVTEAEATASRRPTLALALAFASGLTSLGYQVLWTRLLSSGTGNSTYVFTLILGLFLFGIAFGAVAFSAVRPYLRNVVGTIAAAQLVVAALAFGGLVLVHRPSPDVRSQPRARPRSPRS